MKSCVIENTGAVAPEVLSGLRAKSTVGAKRKLDFGDACNKVISEVPKYAKSKASLARDTGKSATEVRVCTLFAEFPEDLRDKLIHEVLLVTRARELLKLINTPIETLSGEIADYIIENELSLDETFEYINGQLYPVVSKQRTTGTKKGQKILSKAELEAVKNTDEYAVAFGEVSYAKEVYDMQSVSNKGGAALHVGLAYDRFFDALPKLSHSDLCRQLKAAGLKADDHQISTARSLTALPKKVQAMLLSKKLSFSQGKCLARVASFFTPSEIEQLALDCLNYKLSGDAMRVLVNYKTNPLNSLSDLPFPLRVYAEEVVTYWLYANNKFTKDITLVFTVTPRGLLKTEFACHMDDSKHYMRVLAGKK